jgi:peptidoglycan hydrolase-like protein with peptidoglycan-binding domain
MSRRSLAAAGSAAVVAVAAAVAVALTRGGEEAEAASTEARATATATVQRRDLVVRETFDGTLGYADLRTLTVAGSGSAGGGAEGGGTVTRLPAEGSVVRRGGVLYAVDGRGVRLLYGSTPLYRRLAAGVADGADVRQLEQNLVALGHADDDLEVDGHVDSATRDALRSWQDAIGVPETGALEVGDAVFLPGPRRIGSVQTTVGAPAQPGGELLETSSTRAVVTVDLDARRQDLVRKGDRVQVELPSGRVVTGTIARVGTVAEIDQSAAAQGQESAPTIDVEIAVRGVQGLDGAPVDVGLAVERANGVLAVPVEALLALRGGGYAVEVERAGRRTLVAVTTGTFADGWVEVESAGLQEGTTVVTPA